MASACAGRSALLACAAGTAAGAAAATSSVPLGQGAIAGVAALFFAGSNLVPSEADSAAVLSASCAGMGFFLGFGVGAAVEAFLALSSGRGDDAWAALPIPVFLVLVMLFHVVEFAFVVFHHPQDLTFRSLMLTPVPAGGYSIAMIAALAENLLEAQLPAMPAPVIAVRHGILVAGLVLGLLGWALRALALFTAQSNFTHLVAHRKQANHVLVTEGVYKLCRHPGYLGWFVWSVSTQLVLANPFCFAAYFAVSWKFFADRIPGEEELLVDFFGEQYLAYASRVPCGIPGISRLNI
mmetsp:Transcript_151554/g.486331  ORF Transcript_151554/g.486331 Transcript_151554/m.486331 type:complete len:295 (+) Transcript_151554:1-885(+)